MGLDIVLLLALKLLTNSLKQTLKLTQNDE
jgi:hypothetical protein